MYNYEQTTRNDNIELIVKTTMDFIQLSLLKQYPFVVSFTIEIIGMLYSFF